VENPTGRREYDDFSQAPHPVRSFVWTAPDRAACVRLREFLDRRRGRTVPVWVPTYTWDLALAEDSSGGSTSITIRRAGYGQRLWPFTSRRRLALFTGGLPMILRTVSGVVANGTTETLSLDTPPGAPLLAESARICFLVLCRLDRDLTTITWHGTDCCEAQLAFRELPNEVPA
jgi:hypothetical protein